MEKLGFGTTGILDDFGTPQSKNDFHEANGFLKHKGTKGCHLDPLARIRYPLPSSTDYHQKLLDHVCRHECKDIENGTSSSR